MIPASRTDEFYTIRDHQTKLDITVLQGESRIASENLTLGHIVVPIPDNKAGEEGVKVTFTYDINSILEVEVTVMSTGKKYREVIKGIETDMTDEEIDKRFEELAYLKLPPREQERNRYIFARAERLFMELVGMDRERLENYVRLFEAALDSGDEGEINYKRSRLEEVMDEFDN
ncbi:MAG: Hsp70 family protein [Lachnospiraceae bacterium]|nr:Hsp70 family protein [Lachnospiraceae bacterium]